MRMTKLIALPALLLSLFLIGCSEDDDVLDPTISSFSISSNTIDAGSNITLTAEFSNGTASIDNNVGAVTSGTGVSIKPVASTTYTLTVTNSENVSVTEIVYIIVTGTSYDVTITNITNHQPLTPIAVVLHQAGYNAWSVGSSATTGLEELAESGSPATFLSEAAASGNVDISTTNGAVTTPSSSVTITLTVDPTSTSSLKLSVASMLANTNDAFSGINGVDVSGLASGESMTVFAKVYDAGTEVNDEANIPGPAAGGEGFNTERDSLVDKVVIHPGVVTTDDGLTTSELNETHRWQTYAAKISITKTN